MTKVLAVIAPVAWRWRFKNDPTLSWGVRKDKPRWYLPTMTDIDLEPLYSASDITRLLVSLTKDKTDV